MTKNIRTYLFMAAIIFSVVLPRSGGAKVVDEHVHLITAGVVDRGIVDDLKRGLPDLLPMATKAEVERAEEIPARAYDPARKQYEARRFLDGIAPRIVLTPATESALIITDVDLFVPELNFVFGMADKKRVIALLSVVRLRNEFYGLPSDERLFRDRVRKEALHELGHAWGLDHCALAKCVMFFSNTLADTDRKKPALCHDCQKRLRGRYISPIFGSLSL